MIKVLALTRYGRLGASSRLRFCQYVPWLQEIGLSVTVSPLFADTYVQDLQQNNLSFFEVLTSYSRRVQALLFSRTFDLLWIEKETLPWLPSWVERILMRGTVPYVLDYDDAVFHYYDQHAKSVVRAFLADKHPKLIKGAALVVAGNAYLAEFARQVGAENVEVIPTVIDLDRYSTLSSKSSLSNELLCVGWIGQLSTASFLVPYVPMFNRLSAAHLARFEAIGIDTQSLGLPMGSIAWSEHTEVASIAGFDIGIMPLSDGPFERGKCGYKLIQYMACGLPVVASPIGVNLEIVEHGVNGFLAETELEWEQALRVLLADPALRWRMGHAGRQKVTEKYCIQKTGPNLARLLLETAKR
jgi:glycosyltransferase involved in cell wall biosynthesis